MKKTSNLFGTIKISNILKKSILIFIAFVILFTLYACSGQASDITIDDIENKLVKTINSSGKLSTEETTNGYDYSYTDANDLMGNTKVYGAADKNEHIKNITIEKDNIDISYFKSLNLRDVLQGISNYDNYNLYQFNGFMMYGYALTIIGLGEDASLETADFSESLNTAANIVNEAFSKPQKNNGWTYSFSFDEGKELVTFNAVYGS